MTAPVFIITSNGNSAVTSTILGGLRVEIAGFRIGSDTTTPATPLDTDLKGSLLYSGTPTSYSYIDDNTIGVRLEIPATAGPFQFGEIGLFMPDGTMFARASFGATQYKYSAGLNGLPNIWRFTAVLRFSQAPVLFNLNTTSQNRILEVGHFGLTTSPSTMFGSPNAVIVQELTPNGDSVFMWAASPTRWAFSKYTQVGTIVLDAPSTLNDLPSSDWAKYANTATQPGKYLIQSLSGDVRSIASATSTNGVLTQSLNSFPIGTVFDLYQADIGSVNTTYVTGNQFSSLVNLFNTQWSIPSGSNEVDAKGWNQTAVPSVAANTDASPANWIAFTNAVDQAADLLDLPRAIPLTGLSSDWTTDYFGSLTKYQALVQTVNSVVSSRPGSVRLLNTETSVHNTTTHAGVWSIMNYDVQLDFASSNDMQAFFNTGGWVGFDTSITPDNYVQRTQQIQLEQMDTIRVCATKSESTGLLKLVTEFGDGLITDSGCSGFWGLTGAPRRVWYYQLVAASGTGATQYNGTVEFAIDAYRISPTSIWMSFSVTDNSDPAYTNDTEGGVPSFQIQAVTGRPDPAILFSPSLVHPTVTVLGTTSW